MESEARCTSFSVPLCSIAFKSIQSSKYIHISIFNIYFRPDIALNKQFFP
jgi:hypothetical protein